MLISEYTKSWIDDFLMIKNAILEKCIGINIHIEHVGSTAVPNLASKPIIDMDIVYEDHDAFEEVKHILYTLGYYHNGNQGILDREVFKRKMTYLKDKILDVIPHHLYVCPKHSVELQRHLMFRDYLRKNDKAREQYQNLKYEIASIANQDRKKYAALKEIMAKDFINSISGNQLWA